MKNFKSIPYTLDLNVMFHFYFKVAFGQFNRKIRAKFQGGKPFKAKMQFQEPQLAIQLQHHDSGFYLVRDCELGTQWVYTREGKRLFCIYIYNTYKIRKGKNMDQRILSTNEAIDIELSCFSEKDKYSPIVNLKLLPLSTLNEDWLHQLLSDWMFKPNFKVPRKLADEIHIKRELTKALQEKYLI